MNVFEMSGLKEQIDYFKQIANANNLVKIVNETAIRVLPEIKKATPVSKKKGIIASVNARNSWDITFATTENFTAEIYSTWGNGLLINVMEYGSKNPTLPDENTPFPNQTYPYEINARFSPVLIWKDKKTGKKIGAKRVTHPGFKPIGMVRGRKDFANETFQEVMAKHLSYGGLF